MIFLSKKQMLPLIVSLLGAAVCVCGFLYEIRPYREAEQLYDEISQRQEVKAQNGVRQENDIVSDKPFFDAQITEKMPDMVAWLRSPDGSLNYPVVQGEDNSFYLNHLADGSENKLGAIFLDYQAEDDFSSEVSVIYGHAARGGQMFGCLNAYKEQAYYDANSALQLDTPEASYTIELLVAYLLDGEADTYPMSFASDEERKEYLRKVSERSFFKSAFPIEERNDRLVILSTCTYEFQNARLAVIGRLREATGDDTDNFK